MDVHNEVSTTMFGGTLAYALGQVFNSMLLITE